MNAWRAGRFQLVFNERLRAELVEVVSRPTFRRYFTQSDAGLLIQQIDRVADFVDAQIAIRRCRDPKDDVLLDVAASGKAGYLVTLDPDLLADVELTEFMLHEHGVTVVRPSVFFDVMSISDTDFIQ